MRVAAYQAPLLAAGSMEALSLIRRRVEQCEAERVTTVCCPEAILGGLADYGENPTSFAIPTGRIDATLASLRGDTVTIIVGFTERADTGRLHNCAAVCHQGSVVGVYVTVTAAGMQALTRALQAYERLLDGLDVLRGARA